MTPYKKVILLLTVFLFVFGIKVVFAEDSSEDSSGGHVCDSRAPFDKSLIPNLANPIYSVDSFMFKNEFGMQWLYQFYINNTDGEVEILLVLARKDGRVYDRITWKSGNNLITTKKWSQEPFCITSIKVKDGKKYGLNTFRKFMIKSKQFKRITPQ